MRFFNAVNSKPLKHLIFFPINRIDRTETYIKL